MILVTAALKEELGDVLKSGLITGIGKVNAATALSGCLMASVKIKAVVNFGTAASAFYPKGTIVQCTKFFERDMQCKLPEFTRDNPPFLEDRSHIYEQFKQTDCNTSDAFLNYFQVKNIPGVCDMEAFALAKVCKAYEIPFLCFKAISDGFSQNSEQDWREHLDKSASEFRKIYNLIKGDLNQGNEAEQKSKEEKGS